MARCLMAVGANLGDRRAAVEGAVERLAATPGLHVVARSAWLETAPVGGPAGQGAFLNGALLVACRLSPRDAWLAVAEVERSLGRRREVRWGARTIDLDLLLYDELILRDAELTLPHPRMEHRRFVLDCAVQAAPAMIHPESGWTVAALQRQLLEGVNEAAVVADRRDVAERIASQLRKRFGSPAVVANPSQGATPRQAPAAIFVPEATHDLAHRRPRVILAWDSTGRDAALCRRILQLPATGPVAWLSGDEAAATSDAAAALQAAWPGLSDLA